MTEITPRVINARRAVGRLLAGGFVEPQEVRLALETLTAAGVFEEIDAATDVTAKPVPAPKRRALGARGASADSTPED